MVFALCGLNRINAMNGRQILIFCSPILFLGLTILALGPSKSSAEGPIQDPSRPLKNRPNVKISQKKTTPTSKDSGRTAQTRVATQTKKARQGFLRVPNCRLVASNQVQLASEQSGVLSQVAQPGQMVQANQIVARLKDGLAMARLAISEKEASNDIEVRFSEKAQQLASLKYEKVANADKTLAGTVTQFELMEMRLDAQKAILQLEQAQHQFEIAKLRRQEQVESLNGRRITAPFSGFVRTVHKKAGEVVGEGETILELINTSIIRVEFSVKLEVANRLALGKTIGVQIKSPNQKVMNYQGKIVFVDVKVEPVTQTVKFWADVENRDGQIRDGMLSDVLIPVQ